MKKFLFLIWLGFLISCQKTDETPIKENEGNTKSTSTTVTASNTTDISHIADWKLVALTGNPHISVKEATNLAIEAANQMEGLEGASKRITPVQVASIDVIQNGKKISSYTARAPQKVPFSTDLYLIHFQDDRGYALISADRRAKGIMAYNSYGKFSLETNDPIQKMLFDRIQKYIEMQRVLYETKKDSLRAVAEEEIFKQLTKEEQERFLKQNSTSKLPESEIPYCLSLPDDDSHNLEDQWVEEKDWIEKVNIPPLIKTWWEQGSPYNAKVSYECNGIKAPVGCVAMAVGQLLTYHKKPERFKERIMHWHEMDRGRTFYSVSDIAKEDIQYLLAHLGDSDMLAMNYECKQSGSNINKAILTFKKLGYKNINYREYYPSEIVRNEIIQRRPIYIRGCDATGCHAWILDGCIRKEQEVRYYFKCREWKEAKYFSETNYINLFHNNWGWGSLFDGWYYEGIFKLGSYADPSKNIPNGKTPPTGEGNYNIRNQVIINIQ